MTPIKDYKYFDQDITVYNGDKPLENEDNYSIKHRRVKEAVIEFSEYLYGLNTIQEIQEAYIRIFGDFEE